VDVIRASGDDTLTGPDTTAHADVVAVAYGDVDVSTREAFAADLNEDVRPSCFRQQRLFRDCHHPFACPGVEDGGQRLTDQQVASPVVDVEQHRQRAGSWIDDAGGVHVVRFDHQRVRTAGNLEGNTGDGAKRCVGSRDMRLQSDSIGSHDSEERCAFVVRRAKCCHDVGDHAGNGGTHRERAARGGTAASSERLVALVEPGPGSGETGFGELQGALCVFDAAPWHRAVGKESLGPRQLRTAALDG
jgi:hypothetical protein